MNSMTGFGRAIASLPNARVRIEISGVNRKQAEIAINVPRSCSEWEQYIRPIILQSVSRGRVGVSISLEDTTGTAHSSLSLDEQKLKELESLIQQAISKSSGEGKAMDIMPNRIQVEDLIRLNIITDKSEETADIVGEWSNVEPALQAALADFVAMRGIEGANLKNDLLSRIATLEEIRTQIMQLAPGIPQKLGEAMKQRLADAGIPVDLNDDRIIREIALFADKCDISEETARLDSHFAQFKSICDGNAPAGRPLDFLCQEIFREFNTIGSKANDAALAHLVVSAKTELEKVREQVQNIE